MAPRTTAIIGVTGFALIAAGGLLEPLWEVPGTTASDAEIAAYVARNRDGFIAAVTVYAFGMGLFLAFAAGLWIWLREREGVGAGLPAVFALGSVSLVSVVFAGFAAILALAYRAPGVNAARELYDLCFGLLALSGVPTAVALSAFAAIVFKARPLPAVTGWVAALGALAHVVIAGSFLPRDGFFSLEGGVIVAVPSTLFLWLLVTSIALWNAAQRYS